MFNRSNFAAIAAGLSVALASAAAVAGDAPASTSVDGVQVFPNVTVVKAEIPASDQATTMGASGFRAFKDKDTGRLRNPTIEEMSEVSAAAEALAPAPSAVTARTLASGLVAARLDESFNVYSVATKSDTGKVHTDCAMDEHAAHEMLMMQPREENNNER